MYDILILGSGIACAMTVCELAKRIGKAPVLGKKLHIGVVEKEGEFWNGIPYGRRSLAGALAFQKLQDFLDEPERSAYIEWLIENKHSWLPTLLDIGGPNAARWVADNQHYMETGQWSELYVPRFLFGMYVTGRTRLALEQLSLSGRASVTLIHGEATAVVRGPEDSYVVSVESAGCGRIAVRSERLVLAIGSPPQKCVRVPHVTGQRHHTHIDDLYSPSEEINVRRMVGALQALPDKSQANIFIVGSNASSLEVLYLINYRSEIRDLINSVVVISRSGILPYKIRDEDVGFHLASLESLQPLNSLNADELMAAIASDLRRAEELQLNIADLHHPVGNAVMQLVSLMNVTEQEKFFCQHGFNFSRMLRRAGRDTRDAADELVRSGLLTMLKGEFRCLEPAPGTKGLMSAVYTVSGSPAAITHPVPFSLTINCGGFEELDCCSSPLIRSLIQNELCRSNTTNRGFWVNERLEANKNLYVIGPLVGGNFNEKIRFWHVESASRITGLAKLLVKSLWDSLVSPGACASRETSTPTDVMNPEFARPPH